MNARSALALARSSVVAAALALSTVSLPLFSTPVARADTPIVSPLVISEINPFGSAGNPADQWIELYNDGSSVVNFAATPYRLATPTGTLADLTAGLVLPNGYFLVSRQNPASAPTDLSVAPDQAGVTTLSLLGQDRRVLLQTVSGTTASTVDQAGDGVHPLALGNDGTTGDMAIASIARTGATANGSLAASWFTPHTIGSGFKSAAFQYGTPANHMVIALDPSVINGDMVQPTGLAIASTPASQAQPTVSGKALPAAGAGLLPAYRATVQFQEIGSGTLVTLPPALLIPAADGSYGFSASPATALNPGLYRVSVFFTDSSTGNRSASAVVPTGSAQNVYAVEATLAVVPVPQLNNYATLTNAQSVTLTGSVQPGVRLVVAINGAAVPTFSLAPGQTAFSLPVSLQKDAVNSIEVRAEDGLGNVSQPAVATITQDSQAPQVSAAKVAVTSNKPGIDDTVAGQAGAVTDLQGTQKENGLTVTVYADQALTQQVGTASVAADGSFPSIDIGDNKYATVYLVAKDQAGNASQPLAISNPISFAGGTSPVTVAFSSIASGTAKVSWSPVPGAAYYTLDYKVSGGSYTGSPIVLCKDATAGCSYSASLINLKADTQYTIAVTAIDQYGNALVTESNFNTLAAPVAAVVQAVSTASVPAQTASAPAAPAVTKPAPVAPVYYGTAGQTTPPAATPTPTPTASSTPAPSPEATGQVKSAETSSSTNYTPWIILAVLIALAVLATLGYFYWFGAEELPGEQSLAAARKPVAPAGEASDADEKKSTADTKERDGANKKAPPKEKRW